MNVIFCGTLNEALNKSWGKTNNYFLSELKKNANVVGIINYEIQNRFLKILHILTSRMIYGRTTIRDPFMDFMMEKKFIQAFRKIRSKPDLIIHSGNFCIPLALEKICPHYLYTDATITGSLKYAEYRPNARALKIFKNETERYTKRVSKIFTFNEWSKKSLITDFKLPEDKLQNVGFGANLSPFYGTKNYQNGMILTVVRRGLEKSKGLYLLLEAFKIAYRANPSLKLAVVGTTQEKMEGVTYYENYPRQKTIDLFAEASLFAMPSLFEPNGMVYIEALACKTPILGLNRLAFPEFAGHGEYGFITEENSADISEKILAAFGDPVQLSKMGSEGQDFVVKKYDWEVVVKKILNG